MENKEKPSSIFDANKNKPINERLLKSINIKKAKVDNNKVKIEHEPLKKDGRKFNQRPSLSADESFFSVSDKQARISIYLKILVQVVDELSFIQPTQMSILEEEKWNLNSDFSVPKIANSFNGILIQVLEDFISHKSEREQEIFLTALKKEVDRERHTH